MNSKEVHAAIDKLNCELEEIYEHKHIGTFILDQHIAEILTQIQDLQNICQHEYNNKVCIYCGKEEHHMIKLYKSLTCSRCKVLAAKLDKAGIKYEVCLDEDEMIKLGIKSIPVLEVDGVRMDLVQANNWLKEHSNEH